MRVLSLMALVGALWQPTPSVRASIEAAAPASDGTVQLTVRVVPTGLTLGAYQGSLRFAPGALQLVRVVTPSGDGTRMSNPADSARGVIRFAGYAVNGFMKTEVLTLVVRPVRPLARAEVRAQLDVASDLAGTAVAKAQLYSATGVAPANGRTP